MSTVELPAGLTVRHLRHADATQVYRVTAAVEAEALGTAAVEEADILSDWAKPSHNLEVASIGVFEGDLLVGYAEVAHRDRGHAAVLPEYRGRGIGTWLAAQLQAIASRLGSNVVGMPVPVGSYGDQLLTALGWQVRWTSWVLRVPAGAEIPARPLPEGCRIRAARANELPAVHEVVEDAFAEWASRPREPWADFEAGLTQRPGFEPWQVRVAVTDSGEIVGAAVLMMVTEDDGVTAFVDKLAVAASHRNRGLAQALLVDSFDCAAEHGATRSELSTDSRTGALTLYEKVGMVTYQTWVNRAISWPAE